ncbi:hypothetical protein N2152v2_006110 [Parachlorella kessleri]
MESLGREDIERLMFFEHAREVAEKEFQANPRDAVALTKWGGALLELAHFRQGGEAAEMIEEAIDKFKQALTIDDSRHDALWCLGNAYTSQGFLSGDEASANQFFTKASDCFHKAVEQEPSNDSYRRAKEMSTKAPQLYVELQRQLAAAGHQGGLGGGSPGAATAQKKKPLISDFWYDVAGWACLVGLAMGLVALQKNAPVAAAAK